MTRSPPTDLPAPRCGAPTRSGTPCRARPLANGRCRRHGGTAEAEAGAGADGGGVSPGTAAVGLDYRDPETLAALLPDPAERMRLLAQVMADRALAAHRAAADDPVRDGDSADNRIARAVRTATQATRAELAARKAQADGGGNDDGDSLSARLDRAKRRVSNDTCP